MGVIMSGQVNRITTKRVLKPPHGKTRPFPTLTDEQRPGPQSGIGGERPRDTLDEQRPRAKSDIGGKHSFITCHILLLLLLMLQHQ